MLSFTIWIKKYSLISMLINEVWRTRWHLTLLQIYGNLLDSRRWSSSNQIHLWLSEWDWRILNQRIWIRRHNQWILHQRTRVWRHVCRGWRRRGHCQVSAGGRWTWTSWRQLQPHPSVHLSPLLVWGKVRDVFWLRVSRFVKPGLGFLPQTWRF